MHLTARAPRLPHSVRTSASEPPGLHVGTGSPGHVAREPKGWTACLAGPHGRQRRRKALAMAPEPACTHLEASPMNHDSSDVVPVASRNQYLGPKSRTASTSPGLPLHLLSAAS